MERIGLKKYAEKSAPDLYLIIKFIYLFIRQQALVTKLLGPRFRRSRKFIDIDITNYCNLKCINCDMSCRQAPSSEQMTLGQIQKFIRESIDNNVGWERIRVIGGEPTLHSDCLAILDLLLEYKKNYSPDTCVTLVTNGFGKIVNDILSRVPKEVKVENSSKKSPCQFFHPFNIAPIDSPLYKYTDYSNACYVTYECGIGLTPYGYYPCVVAGSIDRVFGFDNGRKKIPPFNDSMVDQLQLFCKLCGIFRTSGPTDREVMSTTWKLAYEKYKIKKPDLSFY